MIVSSTRTTMRCIVVLSCTILCLKSSPAVSFTSDWAVKRAPVRCNKSLQSDQDRIQRSCELRMATTPDDESEKGDTLQPRSHRAGRKRAILRKYSKAIALSATLMYGPMAAAPFARRSVFGGSTAHAAASTLAPSNSDYNFQDFKDVKKKLSLAPGANVQKYEEILDRVAIEGDAALGDMKPGDMEAAMTIGSTGEEVDAGGSGRKVGTSKKKAQKKQNKKQEVSEWESDEFGFGEDDEDEFEGVLKVGSSSSKPAKGKRKASSGAGDDSGKGDVIVTDKMAFNNYQAALGKDDHMKTIKKFSFYSIFPVFVITLIRGQIRAYREKKKVKRGLALFEQEKKEYEEEMKRKRKDGGDDDEDDDDDDDDDYD